MRKLIKCLAACCCLTGVILGQAIPKRSDVREKPAQATTNNIAHLRLTRVGVVDAPSVATHTFSPPFKCDSDGNIYFQNGSLDPTIQKLTPKGEQVALFEPSPHTDKKLNHAGAFDVALDGELYELVYPHELNRYVFVYKPDGSFKSSIKLDPGFPWFPSKIAVFPSGQMLVTGSEYDKDVNAAMWPFTGVFAQDGSLLKEVKLADDETLHDMVAIGDKRVKMEGDPQGNKAVSFTQLEMAPDGNAYLMRWTNPAIVYAISPGGEAVRRLKVEPGSSHYYPRTLHIFQNRIAILFVDPNTFEKVMKIVDLEGHEIATYEETKTQDKDQVLLSSAFYCYSENPTRFVFLGTTDEGKLQFLTVEPR